MRQSRLKHVSGLVPLIAGILFCVPASYSQSAVDFTKSPHSVEDLLKIQSILQQNIPAAMKGVVHLRSDVSSGTGVVVSADGLIYTAEHVIAVDEEALPPTAKNPDGSPMSAEMKVVLPDGQKYSYTIVATDKANDAAIIKINDAVDLKDIVPVAKKEPVVGEWVFAIGHGNGFDEKRGAAVRLGRIVAIRNGYYKTDCKLIGGDSGGPLFNMKGELIGIHSRVGSDMENNIHIPFTIFKAMLAGIGEEEKP